MRIYTLAVGCLMMAGCGLLQPSVPNSAGHVQPRATAQPAASAGTSGGGGFFGYDSGEAQRRQQERASRDAQLAGIASPRVAGATREPVSGLPAGTSSGVVMPALPTTNATKIPPAKPMDPASTVAADTRSVFAPAPVAPAPVATAPKANMAKPAGSEAAVVEYAMASQHPVGTKKYSRGFMSMFKGNKCDSYTSPDLAQQAFLAQGGPERDSLGLDADGDGYACDWDPAPYRFAVNG